MKILGLPIHGDDKSQPELSLEYVAPIVDHNEITNHWLKVVMCRYLRRNEPLTEAELQDKSPVAGKIEPALRYDTLNVAERAIIEAAKGLSQKGVSVSQGALYEAVADKVPDYTEFAEAMEELSRKGYLNVI